MMLRPLCVVAILGNVVAVAWADPVVLGPVQMDAVTAAGASAYAIAQANATGQNAFTNTYSNAVALNGLLLNLSSYGGGGQAAAMAVATSPSAYIEASAKTGYGAAGEATALAVGTGKSAFAAISAAVVTINGQDYLTGYLAGGAAAGQAIATAPIALSTTSGMAWSPPAVRPSAIAPEVLMASTEVPGGQLVTYTLTTVDPSDNATTGDKARMSLSFFKPPRSRIPPVLPIDISGVIPVMSTALLAKPVAM